MREVEREGQRAVEGEQGREREKHGYKERQRGKGYGDSEEG